jgi:hypothetical protein
MIVTRDGGWNGNRIYWTLTLVATNNYDSLTEVHTPKITCNYSTIFSVFTSRCLVAASIGGRSPFSGFPNSPRPQLPASHFSQVQLSTDSIKLKSKLCYDRRLVGQSVLMSSPQLGPKTRFLLLSKSYGFVDVGRPLWREDGSVVYNFCWPSPPRPAGLMTIFYCLTFEIHKPGGPHPRICIPQEQGGPVIASGIGFPFRRLLWLVWVLYITTGGQSASLSWNKAAIWGLRPYFYYCQTVAVLLIWGALSD